VLLSGRERPAPSGFGLNGTMVVDEDLVRQEMERNGAIKPTAKNPRDRYYKLRDALIRKQVWGFRDGVLWSPKRGLQ
jgi:hypothetical protein